MAVTYIGATLAIATGLPATIDAAGFGALTWVESAIGTVSIGVIGDTHATVPVSDITIGRAQQLKGEVTGATTNIAFAREEATGGGLIPLQAAFKAASDAKHSEYSIRVTERGGQLHYIGGPVMNWSNTEMTTGSYAGFTVDVANNTGEISVYPA